MVNDKHYKTIANQSALSGSELRMRMKIVDKNLLRQLCNHIVPLQKINELLCLCKMLEVNDNLVWDYITYYRKDKYYEKYPKFLLQYNKDLFEYGRCNKHYMNIYYHEFYIQMGLDALSQCNYKCFEILYPDRIDIPTLHLYVLNAVKTENILMLEYLKYVFEGMVFPSDALDYAVELRSVKMIEYLMNNGCEYNPLITEIAAQFSNLECFKYLIMRGVIISPYAHIVARECGNYDIAYFILNNN
jgi:hypothetical protein